MIKSKFYSFGFEPFVEKIPFYIREIDKSIDEENFEKYKQSLNSFLFYLTTDFFDKIMEIYAITEDKEIKEFIRSLLFTKIETDDLFKKKKYDEVTEILSFYIELIYKTFID